MPRRERLTTTISMALLGLLSATLVPPPSREIDLVVLGSQLTLGFAGATQLALLVGAIVCAGMDGIVREALALCNPDGVSPSFGYVTTFFPLPALLVSLALMALGNLPHWGYQVIVSGLCAALLGVVIILQRNRIGPRETDGGRSRQALNIITYAVALAFFVSLYALGLRSILSATGVLLVGSFLSLELLSDSGDTRRTWLYAGLIGLMLGEVTWALNYGSIAPRTGGALLLVVFYVLTGLCQHYQAGQLSRRIVGEYAVVGALGLGVLLLFGAWI